jgi:hypothetical protein
MQQDQAAAQPTPALQVGIQELPDKDIEAATLAEVLLMRAAVAAVLVDTAEQVKAVMQAKAAWVDKLELLEILLGMQAAVQAEVMDHRAAVAAVALVAVQVAEEIIQVHTVTTDSFNLVKAATVNQELVVVVDQADITAAFRTATAAKVAPE